MKSKFTLLALSLIIFSSCSSTLMSEKKLVHIQPIVKPIPVLAEVTVQKEKKSATGNGSSKEEAEQIAYNNFMSECSCDVIVAPMYSTKMVSSSYVSVIFGYAGTYSNFKSAPELSE